jgi:hypothetical protein
MPNMLQFPPVCLLLMEPELLMGLVAVTSRQMRRIALDAWVEQALVAADIALAASGSLITLQALHCLRPEMGANHAAMIYMSSSARATPGNHMPEARALRDLVVRCAIREVGLCKPSLFQAKMREVFGSFMHQNEALWSQLLNARSKNIEKFARHRRTPPVLAPPVLAPPVLAPPVMSVARLVEDDGSWTLQYV